MKIPESYRQQDGCWNCKHCYPIYKTDDGMFYYCGLNGEERPERLDYEQCEPDEYFERTEKIYEWEDGRSVSESGKCDMWKEKE